MTCTQSVCVATNAEELLHECRAANDQHFEIHCPPNNVIIIRSAAVGFIPNMSVNTDEDQCQLAKPVCLVTPGQLDDIATECNERPRCHLLPNVFNNSPTQCQPHQNGTVIRINIVTYKCIKGKCNVCCVNVTFVYNINSTMS